MPKITKASLPLALLGLAATSAHAQTVATAVSSVYNSATPTSPVAATVSGAVVTFIISSPGTTETFLLQDSDAQGDQAIEVYKSPTTSYTPAVGDSVTVSGAIQSFHGLLEFESNTSPAYAAPTTTFISSGNALPTPTTFTTEGMQNGATDSQTKQSQLGTLSNVTFVNPTGTTFAVGSYNVTDGIDTAVVYVGANTPLVGMTIPTTAVNIYGYMGQYATGTTTKSGSTAFATTGYELDPLAVTAAPEPSGFVVLFTGASALGLIAIRRRKATLA